MASLISLQGSRNSIIASHLRPQIAPQLSAQLSQPHIIRTFMHLRTTQCPWLKRPIAVTVVVSLTAKAPTLCTNPTLNLLQSNRVTGRRTTPMCKRWTVISLTIKMSDPLCGDPPNVDLMGLCEEGKVEQVVEWIHLCWVVSFSVVGGVVFYLG